MFEKIELFSMAQALAKHGATRQATIAQNIANADTPGYRARDIAAFSEAYRAPDAPLASTRPGHFLTESPGEHRIEAKYVYRPNAASPNGNNVSLESEMFAAAEAKRDHDQALAIYKSALNILRTASRGSA